MVGKIVSHCKILDNIGGGGPRPKDTRIKIK